MPDHPNPQGKGQVPLLEHWGSIRPGAPAVKDARTLLNDYVVSLLVLSAEFRFKPVVGSAYHLYRSGNRWRLSLIAPSEWISSDPGVCVGTCYLRTDMTWKLVPADDLERQTALVNDLTDFVRNFLRALDSQDTLEAGLPFYVPGLAFYQRLLATGLASLYQQDCEHQRPGGSGCPVLAGRLRRWQRFFPARRASRLAPITGSHPQEQP